MLTKSEAISQLNKLGATSQPFSFYCDFLGENWCIETDASNESFQLEILDKGFNVHQTKSKLQRPTFKKHPIGFTEFNMAFDCVIQEINYGNSFLTNLTFETLIETNLSLEEIFHFTLNYGMGMCNSNFVCLFSGK